MGSVSYKLISYEKEYHLTSENSIVTMCKSRTLLLTGIIINLKIFQVIQKAPDLKTSATKLSFEHTRKFQMAQETQCVLPMPKIPKEPQTSKKNLKSYVYSLHRNLN